MKTKVQYAFSLFCAACVVLIYQKIIGHPFPRDIINYAASTSNELTAKTLLDVGPLTMVTIFFVGVFPGSDLFTLDEKMEPRPNKAVFTIITTIILGGIFATIAKTQLPFVFKANYLLPFSAGIIVGFVTQAIGLKIYNIQNNRFFNRGFWRVMAVIFVIIVYLTIEGR